MDPYKRSILSTIEQEDEENDDEQVKKTLRYFDSMLDEYLQDHEFDGKTANRITAGKTKEFNPSERKNSSAFQKYIPRHPSSQVRRYTSENNLDQLHLLPKSAPIHKSYQSTLLHSSVISTEDLSSRNASKKSFSASQNNLPTLNEQISSMGITASLIDLSQHQQSKTGPLFRFVPPKETKKYPPNIVKPMVIVPNVNFTPFSTPSIRSTENHFHHENSISAFKPLVSTKTTTNDSSSTGYVGSMNSTETKTTTTTVVPPITPARPQFHQSMFDLPVQSTESSPTKHTHYIRQVNPNPRPPARYHPGSSTSSLLTEPVNKWLQQMKDSSAMNPSYIPTRIYPSTGSMMNEFDSRQRTQYSSRSSYVPQGNIYHFDAKPPIASRTRTNKSTHSTHGNDLIVTTYL